MLHESVPACSTYRTETSRYRQREFKSCKPTYPCIDRMEWTHVSQLIEHRHASAVQVLATSS